MKKVFCVILATLLVLATFTSCNGKSTDETPKAAPQIAIKVNDNEIMVTEFNFYYMTVYSSTIQSMGDYISMLGLDTTKPLSEQECSLSEEYNTWHDYFLKRTEEQIKSVIAFCDKAESEGMTLSEENKAQIDKYLNEDLPKYAESDEKNIEEFCEYAFGEGMTIEILRTVLERFYLSTQWQEAKSQEITNTVYTNEEMEQVYQENKLTASVVDYRLFSFSYVSDDETSEEEAAKQLQAVRDNAKEMADKIENESDFNKLAIEYSSDTQKELYEDDSKTLVKNATYSEELEISEWAFDESRKVGDVTVIENKYGADVLYLSALPHKDQSRNINVRHILFKHTQSESEATDEEKAAAKKKAEDMLAQWQSGVATEESFAELATNNTEDDGSKSTGGLYENVKPGDMVAAFNDWCFADDRKIGDTGIVETDYGFHVMYFSDFCQEAWLDSVRTILDNKMKTEIFQNQIDKYTITEDEAGLELVKSIINKLML